MNRSNFIRRIRKGAAVPAIEPADAPTDGGIPIGTSGICGGKYWQAYRCSDGEPLNLYAPFGYLDGLGSTPGQFGNRTGIAAPDNCVWFNPGRVWCSPPGPLMPGPIVNVNGCGQCLPCECPQLILPDSLCLSGGPVTVGMVGGTGGSCAGGPVVIPDSMLVPWDGTMTHNPMFFPPCNYQSPAGIKSWLGKDAIWFELKLVISTYDPCAGYWELYIVHSDENTAEYYRRTFSNGMVLPQGVYHRLCASQQPATLTIGNCSGAMMLASNERSLTEQLRLDGLI